MNVANAATFNFSFSNEDGSIPGTVEGTLELPDGDFVNQAATSVIVTSAPAALGYTIPLDVSVAFPNVEQNSFTVVGGMIDASASQLFLISADFGSAFGLSSNLATFLSVQGSGTQEIGVWDADNSTLIYTASTPESSYVISLVGLGVLGVGSKLKKKA